MAMRYLRARQALAGVGFAAVMALQLAVVVPATIYAGNQDEFRTALLGLLALYLPSIGALLAVGALCGALLPAAAFRRGLVLTATVCLLFWLQAYLLVWHYGLFDGRSIDWSRDRWRGWLDSAIWIGALLAVDHWPEPCARFVVRGAVAICLVQASVLAVSLATASGPIGATAGEDGDELVATLASFSPERNVLHILADGYQADIFEELMADRVGHGSVAEDLDGFVFFQDHMGAFPYTHMSVPALVSGRLYDNREPQARFMARALGDESILHAARAAGFDVEVAIPEGTLATLYGFATDAHLLKIPLRRNGDAWRTNRDEALLLADLTLFRIVPHFVKPAVYNDQSWLLQSLFGHASVPGRSFFAHNAFLRELAVSMTARRARPVYRMIHVMLLHSPAVANAQCGYAGRVLPQNRENVRTQARCSLGSLLVLLERMRQLGVYDSTTIVITGDHGAWVAPAAYGRDKALQKRAAAAGIPPGYVGQAKPLLLVKPPNAHGPLRVSTVPSWIVDTPATIADAAGIPGSFPGIAALRNDGAPRERRFYIYDFTQREWSEDYLSDLHEYLVRGRVDEAGNWRRGSVLRRPSSPATGTSSPMP